MATGKEKLISACRELGIAHIPNFKVATSHGEIIQSEVFIEHFSNPIGIMVFDFSYQADFLPYRAELVEKGYGASFWDLSSDNRHPFEIENFVEIFCEWGWTGSEDAKPKWIRPWISD